MSNIETNSILAAPLSCAQADYVAGNHPYGLNHQAVRPGQGTEAIALPFHCDDNLAAFPASLEGVIEAAHDALVRFSHQENLADQLSLAFGEHHDSTSAAEFFETIRAGGITALPKIQLVEGDSLNQAYGVYARSTDTIYFSNQFLTRGSSSEQVEVLLEEIGHSLDARINEQDAAGDEGALFARLVLGQEVSALALAQIKAEDDSAVLQIDGQIVAVEMNGTPPNAGLTSNATVAEALFNGQVYQTVRGADNLIYTRTSSDRITWTNWSQSGGGTLDNPSLTVFNNRLYQLVRGGDNGIYQRFSGDGQTWSGWQQFGGGTLDAPTMAVFNNQLYQLVRGGDNGIYQRFSGDGQTWSGWQQFGGGTLDAPAMTVFNNQLYQTVRGGDNGIYQRFSSDGQTWSGWQQSGGGTLNTPAVGSFNNLIFQAVRGGDARVYWRSSSNGQTWNSWQALSGVEAIGSPQLTRVNGYLTVTVVGSDGQIHSRYSSDGQAWSNWNAAPPGRTVSPSPDSEAGFDIEFDYRFDTNGWFTPERRAALEAAAKVWEDVILDDFDNTPAGTQTPLLRNPQTNETVDFITDREIDDLLIFVGARSFNGDTLGVGGPSGFFLDESRYTGDDFEPWAGSVAFNRDENWFFDPTPDTSNDLPFNQPDFISTAVHEIGHVLGFISGLNAFSRHLDAAGNFAGPNARARNGGNPIPLTGAHIQDGYEFGGSGEAVLDPSSVTGERQLPTVLDIAILNDIGYSVDYSKASQNQSSSGSITTNTGQNDTLVPHSEVREDSLQISTCQCASCCEPLRGLNQLGDGSLAALIAA